MVRYNEDYLKERGREISPALSLRIDATDRGIEIDADSEAIKEVLTVEREGRKYPDYHIRTRQEFDRELFDRLTDRVFKLLPKEIQGEVDDKLMQEKLVQLQEMFK